jgi:protein-tyrosine phosphatase
VIRSILFVCTANICRSPTAEGVLRKLLAAHGAAARIEVASAGTHAIRQGAPPSPRAVQAAHRRGYDVAQHVARAVVSGDFDRFDLILAMDRPSYEHLAAIAPTRCKPKIEMFLEYGNAFRGGEVPDPYGGGDKDYEAALDRIEDGCNGLAALLVR